MTNVIPRTTGLLLVFSLLASSARAEVPSLLNYQGRLVIGTSAFDGTGRFKLALINADASQVFWRNAPDGNGDGEPDNSISLPVSRGLYSVAIGDTTLANMAALPADVFANSAVYLRVWFSESANNFQRLAPDQRVTTAGYAMIAATVSDQAITSAKLAPALAAQIEALSNRLTAVEASTGSGLTVVSTNPQDPDLAAKGFLTFSTSPAPGWVAGANADSPAVRSGHTAIWTGQEMIVWGGAMGVGRYSAGGSSYRPDLDTWTQVTPIDAPGARGQHTSVWTGSEMLVWGGFSSSGFLSGGGRFDPGQQRWRPIPTAGAPAARAGHTAIWTGSRMVVWGGRDASGLLGDGAAYDPSANLWTPLSVASAPAARAHATAIWTGSRMIVWGGQGTSDSLNTGAQLTFDASGSPVAWVPLTTIGAPGSRTGHTAVWTGHKMIVWGGQRDGSFLSDGAAYDPANDTWETLATTGAPSARGHHAAIWTGEEMIVVGGAGASGSVATGSAFNPTTARWRALSAAGLPVARSGAVAVWTGAELLVFGGDSNGKPVAALQRLNPQPTWYFYRKP